MCGMAMTRLNKNGLAPKGASGQLLGGIVVRFMAN